MTDSDAQATPQPPKIRHDWYQTESHVVVNVLAKKVNPDDFKINYENDSIYVSFPIEEGNTYNLDLKLAHEINTSQCSSKVLPSKIEIKLKKKEGLQWTKLEKDPSLSKDVKPIPKESAASQPEADTSTLKYPSSSQKAKDWDKVVTDIEKSEEDKPEGEAALNALFQKIYAEGSDELKKAMNKSFVESGGTVLSTNWSEVRKEKIEVKPPDGMEFKKWDV